MSVYSPQAAPVFDLAAAAPELLGLRSAVVSRDAASVLDFFARLTDPSDHEYAVRVVAEVDGSDAFLQELAHRESSSMLARTLYAARLIVVGWDIRSGYRAQHVSDQQFAAFHEHLRQAERILIDVTAQDPGNSTAWVQRLKTARGLQLGHAEARRRYDRLSRHVPHLYAAQAQLLQQLCPKWSGSFEQVREFARECAYGAPPGSLCPLMLLEQHIEQWSEADDDGRAGAAYLAQPHVRQEIDEAAARSVAHPGCRPGYRWLTAHNLFALVYSLLGDRPAAAAHFRVLGNRAATDYWSYLGDEREEFVARRAAALGEGRRG